jgi:hypothetical protein
VSTVLHHVRPRRAARYVLFALVIVAGAPAALAAQNANATVGGLLVDRVSRSAVEGARVSILGTSLGASSDSGRRFTIAGVPPGVRVIQVRAIGYAVGSWMVELSEGQQVHQFFELEGRTLTVDSITVTQAAGGDGWRSEAGFDHRRHAGVGFFITRQDIQQRRAENLSDLIRVVPGVQTSCRGRNCVVLMPQSTRPCSPEYFLDGYPATFATGPSFPIQQIRGVEIYKSRFDVPAEFQRPNLTCGVIAIWTIEPGSRLENH